MPPPLMNEALPIGAADSGLLGPHLFPFCWTSQRNPGRRGTRRKAHRHLPDAHGAPFFIEAAPIPVKHLRHLLQRLAYRIAEHREIDLGDRFFSVFPVEPDGSACVDFLDPCAGHHRVGSQMLVTAALKAWFMQAWAARQRTAIANGQYFPPPKWLRARLPQTGGVRIEIGFAKGFVPFDQYLVGWLPSGGSRLDGLWLLEADEAIPLGLDPKTFLERCTQQFARAGECVAYIAPSSTKTWT